MKAAFLAALLIVLSPGAALAHGGGHEAVAPQGSGEARASVDADAWSPVCPPGSGHGCACGDSSLCDDCPSPAALSRVITGFLSCPAGSPVGGTDAAAPRRSLRFASGRPRAPPFIS